jgi:hypothetical protein
MYKFLLLFVVLIALIIASQTPATHADNPSARSSQGRFYKVPFDNRPHLSSVDEMSWLAQVRPNSDGEAWMVEPQNFKRLSQPLRAYLMRKYMPQMRMPGSSRSLANAVSNVKDPFPRQTISKENIRVNNPALDTDNRAQYESSAAAFGNNLVVSFYDSAGLKNDNFAGFSTSNDGGATWKQSRIPTYPKGANLGSSVVAVDAAGFFYYATVALDKDNQVTIGVTRSTDGGKNWGKLVDGSSIAGKTGEFQDKGWITADSSPTSSFKNRVYISWTNFLKNGNTQIMFARSLSRGRKFKDPRFIAETSNENGFVQGSMVVTGPDGEIYVIWIDAEFGRTDIKFRKSIDGGNSFSDVTAIASIRNPAFPANGIFDVPFPLPSIAVDPSSGSTRGYVYVTYPVRADKAPDRADIVLARSIDGGATWNTRKINDDETAAEQLLPSVAVAQDGAVAVSWYDRRNDLVNLSLVDVYAAVSTDGGNRFAPNRRITEANWPLVPTPFNLRSGYHGNYYQLATRGKEFLFNWADDRSGTDSDIYIALKTAEELTRSAPDFILSARTSFQAIKAGSETRFVIDSRSVNGATGPLTLEPATSVAGLSLELSSPTIEPGSSVTLTVKTTRELKPGPYLIGVRARRGEQIRSTFTRLTVLDLNPLVKETQNITNDPDGSISPVSVVDDAGNVNLVYFDDSPGIFSIFFCRSTDGGNTFSKPIMLPRNFETFLGAPLIAANEQEIYIAYLELFEQPEFIFKTMITRSTDGGKTFSPAQPVTENSKLFVVPESLQLDNDGSIHFGATTFQPLESNNPVFANFDVRSTDGGKTFAFNKIFESRSPVSQPIVDVEGDGKNVRALFIDFDRQNGALLLSRSTDGGATFAIPAKVPASLSNLLFAGAFFAPNNRTHIIYAEGNINREEFRLLHTRLNEDGQATAPVDITGDALTVLSIGLAADAVGNVIATFEGSRNKLFDEDYLSRVFYCNSIDGGATFSSTKSFEPGRGGDFVPVALLDRAGDYSIIWNGFDGDAPDIFYSLSPDKGRTFMPPVNLTSSMGSSSYADFAFDPQGRFQLLYQDNTPGSFDIFRIKLGTD